MSFQAQAFDLMRFGSSSTASVKAQSYEIWLTQSHQKTMDVFELFHLLQCVVSVDPLIFTFLMSYSNQSCRWEAWVFISPSAVLVMIYDQPSPAAKWEKKKF